MTKRIPTLTDGPDDAPITLILAHGSGAPMDAPFMQTIAAGLGAAGVRVVRFEFPYMQARRADGKRRPPNGKNILLRHYGEVIAQTRAETHDPVAIGGKSMGGRVASMLAAECKAPALVVLGYPFHPSGRPESLRTAHLASLRTPTLILQGERDPMGRRDEVAGYALSNAIQIAWLPDGDHSLKPRKRSGHTEAGNLSAAIERAAGFLLEAATWPAPL